MSIRPLRVEGSVAFVPLTRGHEAIIDVEDVPLVAQFNWCAVIGKSGVVYAKRSVNRNGAIYLHRALLPVAPGMDVDHRDRDGLNNRRSNLRPATKSQNAANRKPKRRDGISLKGICLHKRTGKWQASIRSGGKSHYLGLHSTPEAAEAAYFEAAKLCFGEFARV